MRKITYFTLALLTSFSFIAGAEKIYIDEENFSLKDDKFYIYQGDNTWLSTTTVHRDESGLYTYENNLCRAITKSVKGDYERTWKCPYCHRHYPLGTKCQNPNCPSKYRMDKQ